MQNLDSDATTSGGHAHRMGSEGDKADDVDTPPPGGLPASSGVPVFRCSTNPRRRSSTAGLRPWT